MEAAILPAHGDCLVAPALPLEQEPSESTTPPVGLLHAPAGIPHQLQQGALQIEVVGDELPEEGLRREAAAPTPAASTLASTEAEAAIGTGIPTAHLNEEQRKRNSKFAIMVILYAVNIFAEKYKNSASKSSSMIRKFFIICSVAFFIIIAALFKMMALERATGLVYLSGFLLVLLSYLILLSFHKGYGYAILFMLLPVGAALLEYILQLLERRQISTQTTGDSQAHDMEAGVLGASTPNESNEDADTEDEHDAELKRIFNVSSFIVTCGGVISVIFGGSIVGRLHAIGFFFFCTIVLGIYLMMATTVRVPTLPRHASWLGHMLVALLMAMFITVVIY